MPRMTPIELCIANLHGDFPVGAIGYQSVEETLGELKQRTGKDFGINVLAWKSWLDENPEKIEEKAKSPSEALRLARTLKRKASGP